MAIPPLADDPEASRPYFRRLRELAEEARRRGVGGFAGEELSRGMSDDCEVAIEEGATLVRGGRAIFGRRPGGGNRIARGSLEKGQIVMEINEEQVDQV